MIKCYATKGQFEYMIEARIIPVPPEWFELANPAALSMVDKSTLDLPESQAF